MELNPIEDFAAGGLTGAPGSDVLREEVATRPETLEGLATAIPACRLCRDRPTGRPLPHEPRPIYRVSRTARILIASQAPGLRAHMSGIPFDDASGRRLRDWLGLEPADFYDRRRLAIVPMGFCFPGYDANKGDLPPRPECRAAWHDRLLAALPRIELVLAIGTHAIRYHMNRLGISPPGAPGMADLVLGHRPPTPTGTPRLIPLPHPSWRNTAWLNRNPQFESEILPKVRSHVQRLMVDEQASSR